MHLKGPDLDLKGLPRASDQRGVQRLIHICLGHRDIILKPSRDRFVHLMDHTQRRVAVLYGIHDDAHRKQIVNLVDGLVLIFHLLINAEKMLHAPVDLCRNPRLADMVGNLLHDVRDIFFPLAFAHGDLIDQIIINVRFQIF